MSSAPTSRPPLEPPLTASWPVLVQPVGDQVLGGGDGVVEDVLLVRQPAGVVPVRAVLAAAAQVGHHPDPAGLGEGDDGRREVRRQRDVEAAVAVEHARVRPVGRRHVGPVHHEGRQPGAVGRGDPDLVGDQRRSGLGRPGGERGLGPAGGQVVRQHLGRGVEGGEAEVDQAGVVAGAQLVHRAQRRAARCCRSAAPDSSCTVTCEQASASQLITSASAVVSASCSRPVRSATRVVSSPVSPVHQHQPAARRRPGRCA